LKKSPCGAPDWLRGFLPFANGIATAQTFRKVFRLLDSQALARSFAAWAASIRGAAEGEVIAVSSISHFGGAAVGVPSTTVGRDALLEHRQELVLRTPKTALPAV
jgi:hypothetical protein